MRQAFVLFAIIAGLLLLAEHRPHVVPYSPWLLLAACPLMHVFMHHGRHGHGGDRTTDAEDGNARGGGHHG
jgi:hypothetical protein